MCPKFQSKQSHVASHHTLPRCRVCENAKVSGTNGPELTWPFELAMELWENHGNILGKLENHGKIGTSRENHGKITGKSRENRGKIMGNTLNEGFYSSKPGNPSKDC